MTCYPLIKTEMFAKSAFGHEADVVTSPLRFSALNAQLIDYAGHIVMLCYCFVSHA